MTSATITHLLYLHGFRSSPLSTKARQMAAWIAEHRPDVCWHCPQLPPSPKEAMTAVFATLATWRNEVPGVQRTHEAQAVDAADSVQGVHAPQNSMAVVGSSLGGFYATVVAERIGCRAVLLNPAVDPARDLATHIGETTAWHEPEERFFFRTDFIDELRAITPFVLTRPERYFAIIAKGDEVLDWREMAARYDGCRIQLLEGGDHALSDFENHLPEVVDFLGLSSVSRSSGTASRPPDPTPRR